MGGFWVMVVDSCMIELALFVAGCCRGNLAPWDYLDLKAYPVLR